MSRKNKAIARSFKNDIGQTINPGDHVILVGSRRGAWFGRYVGLVGEGARIEFTALHSVWRHVVTNKKFREADALAALGEKKARWSWPERNDYYAQVARIEAFRKDNYKERDEPYTARRWSYRRRLYKAGEVV